MHKAITLPALVTVAACRSPEPPPVSHDARAKLNREVLRKLSSTFHVVNVPYNNWTCEPAVAPFKAKAVEVLFVNKKIAVVDPSATMLLPNPLDAPNNSMRPDCQ